MSDIYELQNNKRKKNADKILYECGLWNFLSKIGQPHIIGSYRMDLMAWNDLDLDIENSCITREKLYQLTSFVLDVFHPLWYEAKEEVNDEGKRVWFHGFHVLIDDELWNVDLWFFDTETITKAEAYCDGISSAVQKFPVYRERIFRIKDALREKGLYGFYQYSSMDVYRAVLEFGVQDSEELIAKFEKK